MPKPSGPQVLRQLQLHAAFAQAKELARTCRVAQGAAACQRILKAQPRHSGALHLLGTLALQTGATEIAVMTLRRALAQEPRSAPILVDLGRALAADGQHEEALAAFRRALTLRPRDPAALVALGDVQLNLGTRDDALKSYRRALALDPGHRLAAHMVAALSGEQPDATAASYVPSLFDAYAGIFDAHLAETLDYHVPEHLREAMAGHLPPGGRFAAALDLGCGTGLLAAALAPCVDAMDGIDVAPKMLEVAATKQLYRTLREGDLVEVLTTGDAGAYDLVAAADVFIYVGRLDAVLPAVGRALVPGGMFAFSVEESADEPVAIRSSGRFAHSRTYVTGLAAEHGFAVLDDHPIPIRKEYGRPIGGRLFVLRRSR